MTLLAPLPAILLVDDEPRSLESLRRTLEEDFTVFTAPGADEALAVLRNEFVQVVVCDQRMPGQSGVDFLKRVRAEWPDVVRIILSAYLEAESIIAGINEAGIWQYLLKPWRPDQLLLTLRSAVEAYRLQQENQRLSVELRESPPALRQRVESRRRLAREQFSMDRLMRTPMSPLNDVCDLATRVAPHDVSVLITGESGTGKELLARAIHYGSSRGDKGFVVENCGALPDQLLESELFGHKRGAFTGAYEDRIGLFQQADGGTIFLDEIGETSPAFQVKLLRVLQEGEIRPLGSPRPLSVNVRVISATNRDLEADVLAGRFREDLYYRLATVTLHLPPLRQRPMDIPLLAEGLLSRSMQELGCSVRGFAPDTLRCLERYAWPGNVRELRNEILRMLVLGRDEWLGADLLSPRVRGETAAPAAARTGFAEAAGGSLKEQVEDLEVRLLTAAIERHGGNKSRAARELGLSRVGLRAKLARYALEGEE